MWNYSKAKLRESNALVFSLPITPCTLRAMHHYSYLPILLKHEGLRRDEETLQPSVYLNKYVPSSFSSCELLFKYLHGTF